MAPVSGAALGTGSFRTKPRKEAGPKFASEMRGGHSNRSSRACPRTPSRYVPAGAPVCVLACAPVCASVRPRQGSAWVCACARLCAPERACAGVTRARVPPVAAGPGLG